MWAKTVTAGGVAPCAAETTPPKAVMRGTAKEQALCLTHHPSLRDTRLGGAKSRRANFLQIVKNLVQTVDKGGAEVIEYR